MLSMVFGFIGFMFKYKLGAWLGLFFFLISIANARSNNFFSQCLTGTGVVVVGFMSVYFSPTV